MCRSHRSAAQRSGRQRRAVYDRLALENRAVVGDDKMDIDVGLGSSTIGVTATVLSMEASAVSLATLSSNRRRPMDSELAATPVC